MTSAINVTKRGVLTLPVRFRRQLGLTGENMVIAESTPEGVLLRPAVALPIEIYTDERVREFNESEAELAAEFDSESKRRGQVRVFLDANVLFSAAQTDGAVRRLITRLRESEHQVVADAPVWEEARRNLVARYPSALPALDALTDTIRVFPLRGGVQAVKGLPIDDKDKPVLSAAINLDCGALVTGDRTHFGHLFGKSVQGVSIYSPSLAARSLLR